MIVWDHWHIEPSSICALKCPRCPRAELPETLLNKQLTLNFFRKQIGADVVSKIKKITFCGNDGDPIYCREFLDICRWIKKTNPKIQLVVITNGSYKPVHWWTELGEILNHDDEVHWSLDGWDNHSNIQYRVHSDWISIMQGIEAFCTVNSSTYRVWAAIAFRFNQDHLDKMQSLARDLKFDCFQLTKSTKFGSKYPKAYGAVDNLEPTDSQLIASGHRYERESAQLNPKPRPGQALKMLFQQRASTLNGYAGICLIGNKGVFVNSQGEFYPCCWTANRYDHNQAWHGRFNLNTKTFNEIIQDPFWSNDFLKFNSLECQTKCTPDRLSDTSHTLEW